MIEDLKSDTAMLSENRALRQSRIRMIDSLVMLFGDESGINTGTIFIILQEVFRHLLIYFPMTGQFSN